MRRGFTLVELMVVVALVTILGGLAAISINRDNRTAYIDGFASDIRNVLTEARRRALSTRNVYLVSITPTTVQWCQVSTTPDALVNYATLPTTCPAVAPAGTEMSGVYQVRGYSAAAGVPKVAAVQWARAADQGLGAVAWLPMPASVYFLPNGTCDSDLSTPPPQLDGFSVRLQSGVESNIVRKIYLYPLGGRPRLTDTW